MKRAFLIFIIAFIIAKIFIVKASADLNDSLVAYYQFNGNANDVSGNGHHGIVNGAALTTDRFGNPNSAYSFDGVDDYIENNTFQDIPTNITLTAWIKYESYLPNMYTRTIIAKADNNGNNAGFTLHLKETDNGIPRIRFIINDNDDGRSDVISGQITINTWYFVAVSYDGVKQSFFLNGFLVDSKENSGIINPATSNLLIGRSDNKHYGGPVYFHGLIDEIRIYNRVLSENEIQQLYNGPIAIRIPEDATEGDGVLEDQGIVSVFSAPDTDLVINLSSDDTSLVTVPETVTIHADQNTATFDVVVIDNCIKNASQNVTITASASDYISGLDDIQIADNDVSIEMDLPLGWSMISIPVIPCNASVSSLFPEAKTVYSYEKCSGYRQVTENENLEVGKGYWILLDQNQSHTLTGNPFHSYQNTVYRHGWEIIGGCTYSAKVSTDFCNIGVIYDYVQGAGYQRISILEDLEPGRGYWILLRDFTSQAFPNEDFPSIYIDIIELLHILDFPVVTSYLITNLQEVNITVEKCQSEIHMDQNIMTTEQLYAYQDFGKISKSKIAQARLIDKNNNKLLFFRNDIISQNYYSPYLEEINSSSLGQYWKYPEFDYIDYRKVQGDRITINPTMTLKNSQKITLNKGLYFFNSLTLKKGSTLTTNGAVQIYVTSLLLEEEAQMMGGYINNPQPNDLIIMASYWTGYPLNTNINRVKLEADTEVHGHIFSPSLKVYLSRGTAGKETRVHGSVLTHQLVTYNEPGSQSPYGLIQIIYEKFLGNLKCIFELKVSN